MIKGKKLIIAKQETKKGVRRKFFGVRGGARDSYFKKKTGFVKGKKKNWGEQAQGVGVSLKPQIEQSQVVLITEMNDYKILRFWAGKGD